MKKIFPLLFTGSIITSFAFSYTAGDENKVSASDNDSTVFSKIYSEGYSSWGAYNDLKGLCEKAPKRLSGSHGAQVAVEYMQQVMKDLQFDRVWLQPCMVPHWERGAPETAQIIDANGKTKYNVHIAALGGSLATADNGLTAEIIEVKSFDDLDKLGKKGVEGKIVFFNHPFDDKKIATFASYGEAVAYRWQGPPSAEKYGAVGCIVRSVTSSIDTLPHTGVMRSDSLAAKIPSAAISTKDAQFLHGLLAVETGLKFHLKMNCKWYAEEKSYNVIGEILGTEHPEQIIVVGGHLDAWDLGEGAHDDGAGVTGAVEAVRIFKALGIHPKHTIRCVCFMNEENGGRGGKAYADSASLKKEKQIAAIESDAGGFTPRGFGLDMNADVKKKVQVWAPLFLPYGIYDFSHDGGGADIGPLKTLNVPMLGLEPDGSRYFDQHHASNDTFSNVNRRELQSGAASMAAMIYLIDKYGL
ncbi:MAG: M20/M25/M40 family metallo-hydrolase, partial [Bacteroidetes bacterium]|nr:M20/M25/M40 family metallo-hydrolase [Bacteroidota bacterium]